MGVYGDIGETGNGVAEFCYAYSWQAPNGTKYSVTQGQRLAYYFVSGSSNKTVLDTTVCFEDTAYGSMTKEEFDALISNGTVKEF